MNEIIEQILPLWGIENGQFVPIAPSVWEVNHLYVIKRYDDKKQLERNIQISEVLTDCAIPVAKIVYTKTGEKYVGHHAMYFLLTTKLRGHRMAGLKDRTMARKMGCAIAQLHRALIRCETEVEFADHSLLEEMKGWIREELQANGWTILGEEEYSKTVESLERVQDRLPKQVIHRDVHFGNFLFFEGELSGYIDFDLSQRNIRIWDVCYFLTGLLAEETESAFAKREWIEHVKSVVEGYESVSDLSKEEKDAIPCVMECIEIVFVAYFLRMDDTKRAKDAYNAFRFIRNCESDIKGA